jgi:tripartite-type tricarboxylate transporter receptor subunit TctC
MKLPRRRFLHLAAGAAALSAVSRIARAQAYPARPVHWIVGFTPAGGNDMVARLMGQWLSELVCPRQFHSSVRVSMAFTRRRSAAQT